MSHVYHWANRIAFEGDIAYFFESGHRDQSAANALMHRIFKNADHRASYRYASHTFADTEKATPLQAADLLAWQWFTDTKRKRASPRQRREDLHRFGAI
jgi:hypothetical protein